MKEIFNRREVLKLSATVAGGSLVAAAGQAVSSAAAPVADNSTAKPKNANPSFAIVQNYPLEGAFDMHVHNTPSTTNRSYNAIIHAMAGHEQGMRGIYFMCHYSDTIQKAYLARQVVPGIELFGGIALNNWIGGLNVAAIDNFAQFTGGCFRGVKMPSKDAGNDIAEKAGKRPSFDVGLWLIDKSGNLVPKLDPILKTIAKNDLILMTGHVSAQESLAVIKGAKAAGVRKMVLTHAFSKAEHVSIDIQKQCADLGAFVEHLSLHYYAPDDEKILPADAVKAIRKIGAERCILSSDLGVPTYPAPVAGHLEHVLALMRAGLTKEEMDWMIRKNPARLLGLDPWPS